MARLTKAEWKALDAKSGKSNAITKAHEMDAAHYGEECLTKWQIHNKLREKPRYRVKAISEAA